MLGARGLAVAGVGVLVAAAGVAVSRGRLWLLSNYRPDDVDDERRVARRAGGTLLAYGLVTALTGWLLATGRLDPVWFGGWGIGSLVVAIVVVSVTRNG